MSRSIDETQRPSSDRNRSIIGLRRLSFAPENPPDLTVFWASAKIRSSPGLQKIFSNSLIE
jgi:hypothetical protein